MYNQGSETTFQGEEGKTFPTERQPELGVDFTQFRVYDPALGRFWQIDPLAGEVDELDAWTPYNYSFNNPIRWNDPLGDCPTCWEKFKQEFTNLMNSLGIYEQEAKDLPKMEIEGEPKTSDSEKQESGIKDGIAVVKEGDQSDNAPKGDGKVSDETVQVDGVPPNELDRAKTLYDATIGNFIDVVESNYKPNPGDSGIIYMNGQPMVGVRLYKGPFKGGISPFGLRPVKTKEDSVKYGLDKTK